MRTLQRLRQIHEAKIEKNKNRELADYYQLEGNKKAVKDFLVAIVEEETGKKPFAVFVDRDCNTYIFSILAEKGDIHFVSGWAAFARTTPRDNLEICRVDLRRLGTVYAQYHDQTPIAMKFIFKILVGILFQSDHVRADTMEAKKLVEAYRDQLDHAEDKS